MRPICADHAVEMTCAKTGHLVQLNADGQPYQIWSGDRFACPVGGESVVINFPSIPIVENWETTWNRWADKVGTVVA